MQEKEKQDVIIKSPKRSEAIIGGMDDQHGSYFTNIDLILGSFHLWKFMMIHWVSYPIYMYLVMPHDIRRIFGHFLF